MRELEVQVDIRSEERWEGNVKKSLVWDRWTGDLSCGVVVLIPVYAYS